MVSRRYRYAPLAVRVVTGILAAIAVIILLYLLLILMGANQGNPLVSFVGAIADWFSWLFRGMFSADNARLQAVLDYGLAALAYLLVAGIIHNAGRRWGP